MYLFALACIPCLALIFNAVGLALLNLLGINEVTLPIGRAIFVVGYAVLVLRNREEEEKATTSNLKDTFLISLSGSSAELLAYTNLLGVKDFGLWSLLCGIVGGGCIVVVALRLGLKFPLIQWLANLLPEWMIITVIVSDHRV